MKYNWQQDDWPDFHYDISRFQDVSFVFAEKTGYVSGLLKGLPDPMKTEAIINLMVSEAVKTSEIEGEYLNRSEVMSSIRHNLGLDEDKESVADQRAKGAADLMVDIHNGFKETLTKEKLFDWHKMLLSGQHRRIEIGAWRTHEEPMQVVSGPIGKWKVHFEAPASEKVPEEMERFINWFNSTALGDKNEIKNPVLRAAIAHLYFESIHPFEDGNGRIGRALSEKALSQNLGRPILLSLSETIEKNKKAYYNALKTAQRSNEITEWIIYFLSTIIEAQTRAEENIVFILKKTKFFDQFENQLNERQLKVIRRMLEKGIDGFEGGMSTKKYVAITGASKATAARDLQYLTEIGVFKQTGGGRSTRYEVYLG
ncbi:MAG: Fic family protein [Gammaproteobacteria bacterium]|nr:Fic family protein [Gammaproteobacteria bacterium]